MIYIINSVSEYKKSINGKHISVCGIGISNLPLIDFLLSSGSVVTARDMRTKEKLGDVASDLEKKGVKLCLGDGYLDNIDDEIIFRSPGIRPDKPGFIQAIKKGAVLTSEMQIFFELCPCTKIAVTGSDGKTTTTTLISEMLKKAGKKVWLGGNIGKPLLPDVEKMSDDDFAVIELSSFQLMTMTLSPEICVVTNISPNHLDYHKDYEEYISAKKNIYTHPFGKVMVTNAENPHTLEMAKEYGGETRLFSSKGDGDICEKNGIIFFKGEELLKTSDIILPGRHNVENYMAAMGAVYGYVSKDVYKETAKNFGGVEHRLEFVREYDGVKYYNGSIDSTPTRTKAALSAFPERNLTVILGGYDKHLDYSELADIIGKKAKNIVLTGGCAEIIKLALDNSVEFAKTNTRVIEEPDFKKAVVAAKTVSTSGDIVLLSPAAASFDAFKNFEERGRFFKSIVNEF